jgi:hypothetical protein
VQCASHYLRYGVKVERFDEVVERPLRVRANRSLEIAKGRDYDNSRCTLALQQPGQNGEAVSSGESNVEENQIAWPLSG